MDQVVKDRWDEGFARILDRAAREQRKTSLVRTSYFTHCGLPASAFYMNRDGVPLAERAAFLWEAKRGSVELALALLQDPVDRELLEKRNQFVFKSRAVPSFNWLTNRAKAGGLGETERLEAVIEWAVRPDLYRCEWLESQGYPRLERVKPETRARTEAQRQRLALKVEWREAGNPEEPLAAKVGRKKWTVRVNEFPDAPLYSLLENGVAVMDFDDWPKSWSRPTSR